MQEPGSRLNNETSIKTVSKPQSAPNAFGNRRYLDLLIALRKIIRAIDLYSKKISKDTGLTGPQLMVLNEIQLHDSIMVKQLADNINLSPATVTSILDRLEDKSLVERQRSKSDKRRLKLHLTPTGEAILEKAPQLLQHHFIQRFEALEQWEQSQMLANVQHIATMMDAENIDASPLLDLSELPYSAK